MGGFLRENHLRNEREKGPTKKKNGRTFNDVVACQIYFVDTQLLGSEKEMRCHLLTVNDGS